MATANQFIEALKALQGIKYTWGGKTPETGLDCSGLIHYALAQVGVDFVHGSINQIAACKPITLEEAANTPGALLWRQGHDAISLGDNKTIEAVTTPKDGVGVYTNSPQRFTKAGLIPGITYETKDDKVTQFSSPLQVGVYRTDGFDGLGKGREHMGTDWAGPNVGDKTPVRAVAGGVVEAVGGPAKGAVLPGNSGLIVVIDHGVLKDANGADHIHTNYNHLSKVFVKEGERVVAGQIIGISGDTGNVTGVHLHMGVREGNNHPPKYRDYFDPEAWLKRKGITVGKTPPLTPEEDGNVTTVGTIIKKHPTGAVRPPKANSVQANKNIQAALKKMGLYFGAEDGVDGNLQKAAVKKFQKAHGLVQDGFWGPRTKATYINNRKLQNALKAMAGVPDNWSTDGYVGSTTKRWIKYTNERQGWGTGTAVTNTLINKLKSVGAWK